MKLLAVVVLYKLPPSNSLTLLSLLRCAGSSHPPSIELSILLWDNSPNPSNPADLPPGIQYVSAPHNPGLSPAYNRAMELAQEQGCDWLMTLDQDTTLPPNFLQKIGEIADRVADDTSIAAIVPRVVSGKKKLSPFRFAMGAIPQAIPPGFSGVSKGATYAVNSAATLRLASLKQVNGYNPLFPLDISDLDLFHRIARAGMSVYVAGDVIVSHDFSLLNKRGQMSLERYRNLLRDECAFWDLNMNLTGRTERMIRLAGRVCKDLLRPGSSQFQRITCNEIYRRLVTRHGPRVEEWRRWADGRRTSAKAANEIWPQAVANAAPGRQNELARYADSVAP